MPFHRLLGFLFELLIMMWYQGIFVHNQDKFFISCPVFYCHEMRLITLRTKLFYDHFLTLRMFKTIELRLIYFFFYFPFLEFVSFFYFRTRIQLRVNCSDKLILISLAPI